MKTKKISDLKIKEMLVQWWQQKPEDTEPCGVRTLVFKKSDLHLDNQLTFWEILKECYWRFWFL